MLIFTILFEIYEIKMYKALFYSNLIVLICFIKQAIKLTIKYRHPDKDLPIFDY